MKLLCTIAFVFLTMQSRSYAQVSGYVTSGSSRIAGAKISVIGKQIAVGSDSSGHYKLALLKPGTYQINVSAIGFQPAQKRVNLTDTSKTELNFDLQEKEGQVGEVVISGTLKEVRRLESPVPVEVYSATFFRKNPTPSVYEALQHINGVRPQLNCNICNTGDIHINGLEGPYTMILVDGMPIVSSLSTVYGLSGIPNALVERIEIVKGPASSLYGSEAVGGLINIITKDPEKAPVFSADVFSTSWKEVNADVGFKLRAGNNATALTGINYFNYGDRTDQNGDNFTDVTQQHRISIFQKWSFKRPENKIFNLAGRFNYEDRWGGDVTWNKSFRGGTDKYAESIYTNRVELIGNYQLPFNEKMILSFSYNNHAQNSVYGNVIYMADQHVAFSQLTWDRKIRSHDLLIGAALRYTYYDDNSPATAYAFQGSTINAPDAVYLPGLFIQDEITLNEKHKVLLGFRYDYNSRHGNIYTPRFAYKWAINENNILRFNAGTGFRVVNLFTEDHAALTGSRTVDVNSELKPERSFNVNLNYAKKVYFEDGGMINLDGSLFYTYFNNRIIGDFDTDPNRIIYDNLDGYAVSRGISLNIDAAFRGGFKATIGGSLLDVFTRSPNQAKLLPVLTEKWTATWAMSYKIKPLNLTIDYTGNVYGPMRLPLLGDTDPRSKYSPVWSIQNIQFTYSGSKKMEMYLGIKNLLNFIPGRKDPFLIARSNDPFDKNVQYDTNNKVIATADNPYGLTFDPNFVYAPNQGIRGFLGIRYSY